MNFDFSSYFSELGLKGTAQGMHRAFEHSSKIVKSYKYNAFSVFMKENQDATSKEMYTKAVSIFQDHNMRGLMLNDLVFYSYGNLFHNYGAEKELKVTRDCRNIDVLFRLPRGSLYVSATTVPQERKKTDWADEIEVLKHYHARQKKAEKYMFIGLMGNGTTEPSYEKSKRAIKTIKERLGNGGFEIVSLDCIDEHVDVLSEIIKTLG